MARVNFANLLLRASLTAGVAVFVGSAALFAADVFNGKNLDGWKFKHEAPKSPWIVGQATLDASEPNKLKIDAEGSDLINPGSGGVDVYTNDKFGDATIELEVMVPKGSNSGIYVQGEYEVQVLDSFGKTELGFGDMGAIYSFSVPKLNASLAPGEWQKYVIEFQAPKFDAAGVKTANGKFLKVTLNDKVIHENVEVKNVTPGGLTGKETAAGPLMLQGDHGAVAFRKIKITPK